MVSITMKDVKVNGDIKGAALLAWAMKVGYKMHLSGKRYGRCANCKIPCLR